MTEPLEELAPVADVPSPHVEVPVIYEDHLPAFCSQGAYELPAAPVDNIDALAVQPMGLPALVHDQFVPAPALGLEQEFVPNPPALEIADAVTQAQMEPPLMGGLEEQVLAPHPEMAMTPPLDPTAPEPDPLPPEPLFMG
jgi:hypothetical protein